MGKKAARRKQEEVAVKKSATAKKPQVTGLTNRFVKIQALLIFLFAVLLYANTFTHDYAVDDMIVIQKNKLTNQGFAGIGKIMTTDAFYGFFGEDYTFAIEVEFFGQNPHISHVINSILYGVTCVLIFLLLLHLFKTHITEQWQLTIPLIAALLYTAHPLHTEAVANIKGRDEVMGMLFSVLTLLLSVKYIERKNMAMLLLICIGIVIERKCYYLPGSGAAYHVFLYRCQSERLCNHDGTDGSDCRYLCNAAPEIYRCRCDG
jgi:protein O-mannosyl-transferase